MIRECKRYLTLSDIQAQLCCDIRFVSPYVDAGEITIQAGEVLIVDDIDDSQYAFDCIPIRYRELHSSLVPVEIRSDCDYTGLYWFVIPLQVLHNSCEEQVETLKAFVDGASLEHDTINSMIGDIGDDKQEYECDLIKCPSCNHIFLLFKTQEWDMVAPDPNDLFEWKPVYNDRVFDCLNCKKPFIEEEHWEGKTYPAERTSVYDARICAANNLWLSSCRLDEFRVPWKLLEGSGWEKWVAEPSTAALDGDSAALHPRQ